MIILLNEFLLHRVDRSQIKFLVPDWLSFSFFVCYTFRFCCRFVFFFFLIFFLYTMYKNSYRVTAQYI